MDLIRHLKTGKKGRPAGQISTPSYYSILSYCPLYAQAVAAIFDGLNGNRAKRLQNRAEYLPDLKRWRIGYRTIPGRAEQLAFEKAFEASTRYFRLLHGGAISPWLGKQKPKKKQKIKNRAKSKQGRRPRAAPVQARNNEKS